MATTLPTWQSNGQFNPERYVPVQYSADFLKDMMANQIKQYQLAKEAADSDWLKGFKREELAEQIRGHDLTHEAQMAQNERLREALNWTQQQTKQEQAAKAAWGDIFRIDALAGGKGEDIATIAQEYIKDRLELQNNPIFHSLMSEHLKGKSQLPVPKEQSTNISFTDPTKLTTLIQQGDSQLQKLAHAGARDFEAAKEAFGENVETVTENALKPYMEGKSVDEKQSYRKSFNDVVDKLMNKNPHLSRYEVALAVAKAPANGWFWWTKDFDSNQALKLAENMFNARQLYSRYKILEGHVKTLKDYAANYQTFADDYASLRSALSDGRIAGVGANTAAALLKRQARNASRINDALKKSGDAIRKDSGIPIFKVAQDSKGNLTIVNLQDAALKDRYNNQGRSID